MSFCVSTSRPCIGKRQLKILSAWWRRMMPWYGGVSKGERDGREGERDGENVTLYSRSFLVGWSGCLSHGGWLIHAVNEDIIMDNVHAMCNVSVVLKDIQIHSKHFYLDHILDPIWFFCICPWISVNYLTAWYYMDALEQLIFLGHKTWN